MSKISLIYTYFSLVIVVCASCLPEPLEVKDVPVPETQVVVGSQAIPNQFIVLSLSRNFNALSAGPESDFDSLINNILLSELEVAVEVENERYNLSELIPGIYGIDELPQVPGIQYTLKFQNPFNTDSTIASTYSMPFIGFNSIDPILDYTPYDTLLRVNFSISDPLGPNWYMVNVQQLDSDIDLSRRPFTELYSDEKFDGQEFSDNFTVFFRDFSQEDTVLVSLTNISKGYFEFLELRNNQQFLLLDGLGEPVNYPTNVNNGLGYFNVHFPDIRLFDLSE